MTDTSAPLHPILLVDDEPGALESLTIALDFMGYTNVVTTTNPKEVPAILEQRDVEVVLLDLIMPDLSGDDLLREIALMRPEIPVIMTTAVDDLDAVVRCMHRGAFDYLTKPVDPDRLATRLIKALERRALNREMEVFRRNALAPAHGVPEAFSAFLTRDRTMLNILRYCEAVAQSSEPVLITGETGTGKELVARGIHRASGRRGHFVAVNAAGLSEHEFADVLFGHKKGAFTSADQTRLGLVEKAASGTLFLDEIGDLGEASQIKLLRLLQEGEFYPLGADIPVASSARVVAATNKDLQTATQTGAIRRDLYFRLKTHAVSLPPLRQRQSDLPLLLDHFIAVSAQQLDKKAPRAPRELEILLGAYSFPGNVRELKALVHDAVSINTSPVLSLLSFKQSVNRPNDLLVQPGFAGPDVFAAMESLPTLREAAEALINEAMRRFKDNQRLAAGALGITPSALNKRLRNREEADQA